jgi:hypothetical protein
MRITFSNEGNFMNLLSLKNPELNERLKDLYRKERALLHVVLEHIKEIDRRKLYLEMAYPRLFEYLTQEIGYSNASAQRRIDAARFMQEVPELSQKIHDGKITLSQIGELKKAVQYAEKESGLRLSALRKQDLVAKMESRTQIETQILLAQELDLSALDFEKYKYQKDESVRVELTFSKKQMSKLKTCQEELTHTLLKKGRTPNALTDVIEQLMDYLLRNLSRKKSKDLEVQGAKCCQFKDFQTGKLCGSRFALECDHIHPKWDGGGNEDSNLRWLCSAHNKFRYFAGH